MFESIKPFNGLADNRLRSVIKPSALPIDHISRIGASQKSLPKDAPPVDDGDAKFPKPPAQLCTTSMTMRRQLPKPDHVKETTPFSQEHEPGRSNAHGEFVHATNVEEYSHDGKDFIVCSNFMDHKVITFELGPKIGEGATSSVRTATVVTDLLRSRCPGIFAIKDIPISQSKTMASKKEQADKAKENLRREVSIMASLRHPGVISIYGALESSKSLFLLMEHAPGGELFKLVSRQGTPTDDQMRFVVYQIGHTLRYMHQRNIIHRDLKLENVLIAGQVEGSVGYYNVKVADFGLSIFIGQNTKGAATSFVGTPHYWAPEIIMKGYSGVATNSEYGTEVDVWSFGCLIYIMVALDYPFKDPNSPLLGRFEFSPRFKNHHPLLMDLITKMLAVDASMRLSIDEVLNHPWMLLTRPHVAPGFPDWADNVVDQLTADGRHCKNRPIVLSTKSVLRTVSQEPVLKARHTDAGIHLSVPTMSETSDSEATSKLRREFSGTECQAVAEDLTAMPGKGILRCLPAMHRRNCDHQSTRMNGFKFMNAPLRLEYLFSARNSKVSSESSNPDSTFTLATSLINQLNNEISNCLNNMNEIEYVTPQDIIQKITILKALDKVDDLSYESGIVKTKSDEEQHWGKDRAGSSGAGFEMRDLTQLMVSMVRNLQWVYLNDSSIGDIMDRLIQLIQEGRSIVEKALSEYEMIMWTIQEATEACHEGQNALAASDLGETDDTLILMKKEFSGLKHSFAEVKSDLTLMAKQTHQQSMAHDAQVLQDYTHKLSKLLYPGDHSHGADVAPTTCHISFSKTSDNREETQQVFISCKDDDHLCSVASKKSNTEDIGNECSRNDQQKELDGLESELVKYLISSNSWNMVLKLLRKVEQSLPLVIQFWDTLIIRLNNISTMHKWIKRMDHSTDLTTGFHHERLARALLNFERTWTEVGCVLLAYQNNTTGLVWESSRLQNEAMELNASMTTLRLKGLLTGMKLME